MKKFYLLFAICALLVPALASAQVSLPYWGPIVTCGKGGCASLCDLFATAQRFIYLLMTLTLFVIGPILIVAGGIMIMISGGTPERFGTGRKMITGAIVGILISLGAFVIINTFFYFIAKQSGEFSAKTYWPTIQCASTNTQPGPAFK